MGKHYNARVFLEEVTEAEPIRNPSGYAEKVTTGISRTEVAMSPKRTLGILEIKISAPSEEEAYDRLMSLLRANRPQKTGFVDAAVPLP